MGVIGTSKKEDERRFPIHPEHLSRLSENIRKQLIFEKGYGNPFHISDQEISELTGGIATRSEILRDIGDVIIAKPVLADLEEIKTGGVMGVPSLCSTKRNYSNCNRQKIDFDCIWGYVYVEL